MARLPFGKPRVGAVTEAAGEEGWGAHRAGREIAGPP
jgi:hypothetical protein